MCNNSMSVTCVKRTAMPSALQWNRQCKRCYLLYQLEQVELDDDVVVVVRLRDDFKSLSVSGAHTAMQVHTRAVVASGEDAVPLRIRHRVVGTALLGHTRSQLGLVGRSPIHSRLGLTGRCRILRIQIPALFHAIATPDTYCLLFAI